MEYEADLPSLYLKPDDLDDLITILKRNSTQPQLRVKVSDSGYSHKFESVDELLSEPALSAFIIEYDITMHSEEGRVEIDADSFEVFPNHSLLISGDPDWVRSKKEEIESFTSNKRRFLRTVVHKIGPAWAIIPGFLMGFSVGAQEATNSQNLWVLIGILAAILTAGLFFTILMTRIVLFPYTMIVRDQSATYHPYFWKLITVLTGVAALLTVAELLFRGFILRGVFALNALGIA